MADQPLQELTCECGHLIADHAWSGWGENSVCTEWIDEEHKIAGWHGVCPCVRREGVAGPDLMADLEASLKKGIR